MMGGNFLFYLGAFVLVLGVLIVVHELGHYFVARLCGVKVLRFSVGFGRPLLLGRYGPDGTEWAIAAFPLGGYVKMLDEREGQVEPHELSRAFNRQSVWKRILIVVAGPLANLLLAILLYSLLFMQGTEELRPILAAPPAATAAAAAAVQDGETVRSVNGTPVATWQELRWILLRIAMDHAPVILEVINQRQEIAFRRIDTQAISAADLETDLPARLGLKPYHPQLKPIIGKVTGGSVAEQAGMRAGDEFVAIAGRPVRSWSDVSAAIRQAAGSSLQFDLRRDGALLSLLAKPAEIEEGGQRVGRIGIMVQDDPVLRATLVTTVRYGVVASLVKATVLTWDTSIFSVKMMGRMIVGEISWKNLSGPVTIADYAGQSARLGLPYYLKFMALISISLGVLNLLPIPILDGGHLLYYMAEIIKGGPLPERLMEIGQKIGLFLLLMLMAFAFYNDFNRLVSG